MVFVGRKIVRLTISLLFVLSSNFVIPRLMPGDPLFTILGPDVVGLSQKDFQELETEYGLNQPVWQQYRTYVCNLFLGNLGYSYYHHQPVDRLIQDHLKQTLLLMLPAVVISSLLAVGLGILAGKHAGSALDIAVTLAFLVIYAMPVFLLAMVGLEIFSFRLDLFPLGNLTSPHCHQAASCATDLLWHLTLPVLILSLSGAAAKYLVTRNSVMEIKTEDYVLYARAKGVSETAIWGLHILKNASLPLLSLIALHLAFMVSGALLTEIVFSINGMGILIYEAAINRDYPVLQGCFLILTVVVLGMNTLVDLLCGILDPRVRA